MARPACTVSSAVPWLDRRCNCSPVHASPVDAARRSSGDGLVEPEGATAPSLSPPCSRGFVLPHSTTYVGRGTPHSGHIWNLPDACLFPVWETGNIGAHVQTPRPRVAPKGLGGMCSGVPWWLLVLRLGVFLFVLWCLEGGCFAAGAGPEDVVVGVGVDVALDGAVVVAAGVAVPAWWFCCYKPCVGHRRFGFLVLSGLRSGPLKVCWATGGTMVLGCGAMAPLLGGTMVLALGGGGTTSGVVAGTTIWRGGSTALAVNNRLMMWRWSDVPDARDPATSSACCSSVRRKLIAGM